MHVLKLSILLIWASEGRVPPCKIHSTTQAVILNTRVHAVKQQVLVCDSDPHKAATHTDQQHVDIKAQSRVSHLLEGDTSEKPC